MNLHRNPHKFE